MRVYKSAISFSFSTNVTGRAEPYVANGVYNRSRRGSDILQRALDMSAFLSGETVQRKGGGASTSLQKGTAEDGGMEGEVIMGCGLYHG
jgi:hypothetical protein